MKSDETDAPAPPGRQCYRCNEFVRMSGPESARWPNTWTICPVCRDKLNIEAGFVGTTGRAIENQNKE